MRNPPASASAVLGCHTPRKNMVFHSCSLSRVIPETWVPFADLLPETAPPTASLRRPGSRAGEAGVEAGGSRQYPPQRATSPTAADGPTAPRPPGPPAGPWRHRGRKTRGPALGGPSEVTGCLLGFPGTGEGENGCQEKCGAGHVPVIPALEKERSGSSGSTWKEGRQTDRQTRERERGHRGERSNLKD